MPHPCIIPWNEASVHRHAKGLLHPFVDEACGAHQLRLHVSVIDPGEAAHPPHQHAGEEIIFLLEGQGEATIGGEIHPMQAMSALFCPEHVMHGLRNSGPTPIKYAVIRVPEIPAG
jgi:quercetin dioxygenase-like cupin family protein